MSALSAAFGRHVCFARLEHGWTQTELAVKSGIPQRTISGCETGLHEPSLGVVITLAAALGLSLDAFSSECGRSGS